REVPMETRAHHAEDEQGPLEPGIAELRTERPESVDAAVHALEIAELVHRVNQAQVREEGGRLLTAGAGQRDRLAREIALLFRGRGVEERNPGGLEDREERRGVARRARHLHGAPAEGDALPRIAGGLERGRESAQQACTKGHEAGLAEPGERL